MTQFPILSYYINLLVLAVVLDLLTKLVVISQFYADGYPQVYNKIAIPSAP